MVTINPRDKPGLILMGGYSGQVIPPFEFSALPRLSPVTVWKLLSFILASWHLGIGRARTPLWVTARPPAVTYRTRQCLTPLRGAHDDFVQRLRDLDEVVPKGGIAVTATSRRPGPRAHVEVLASLVLYDDVRPVLHGGFGRQLLLRRPGSSRSF